MVQEEEIPGRVEVEVEVERENGCGAKEWRICEKGHVDLGKPGRGGLEERGGRMTNKWGNGLRYSQERERGGERGYQEGRGVSKVLFRKIFVL